MWSYIYFYRSIGEKQSAGNRADLLVVEVVVVVLLSVVLLIVLLVIFGFQNKRKGLRRLAYDVTAKFPRDPS